MKINKLHIAVIAILSIFAINSLQAQTIKGIVKDSNNNPLLGASVYWDGTTVGASASGSGEFQIHRVKGYDTLIAAYLGYKNDTILVKSGVEHVDFVLSSEGVVVDNVLIEGHLSGNFVKRDGIVKNEMISFAGLCKMACCNLAESFENSASVTVGYSDAISGARQIKMLGLTGTYTQILDENRPVMRGLSSPYGLSYTPGMWLNSIQVSKGVSSVTAGHDAITGQINLEHRKPTDEERLFVNLYIDDELRPEANITAALPVTKDKKLSTILMFHGSGSTDIRDMDHNNDGFRDMPKSLQLNFANKWLYSADNGAQLRWGFRVLQDSRLGGMVDYDKDMQGVMYKGYDDASNIYGSSIENKAINGYVKFGMPVGASVYDKDEESEVRSNIAFVADYDYFDQDSYFGLNDYVGNEGIFSANLMYNHYFTYRSALIVGVQAQLQDIEENLNNKTPWLSRDLNKINLSRNENEVGAYAEYTYSIKDKFSVVAGVRGDYNSFYDKTYFTPRGQIKWDITPTTTFRTSAGMGYRSSNIVTDNIGILATGRRIVVEDGGDFNKFNRMEEALTLGGSLTQTFDLIRDGAATLSLDYFRTEFYNQVVVDQERNSEDIYIYNTDGRSFTDTYQIDFSWEPVERLDIFATYRYTNSSMTIDRADGTQVEVERPLVSRYKTLLNIQYATRLNRWTFDVTGQLNGPSRIPTADGNLEHSTMSPSYPVFFAQVTRKVGKFDIYVGCENIANYRQENPIVGYDNPFSTEFNSMNVWGPLKGRKFYAGMRFNLY